MQFDVLMAASMRHRPAALLSSMVDGAKRHGIDAQPMREYMPRAGATLVLYGLGGRDRLPHALQHARRGGRYVAWDAGYWERKTEDRRYRVSLDGFHCPARIMAGVDPGPERWNASGLSITNNFHPDGDIILVGNGPKSGAVGATGWAAAKALEIRRALPGRRVIYRPKRYYIEPHIKSDGVALAINIEKVLDKASLVVCRHSNVAVDACRMGIPVVCEDGAASAIYPARLENAAAQPSEATRREFLNRLAWWQWSQSEIARGECWPWLMRQL